MSDSITFWEQFTRELQQRQEEQRVEMQREIDVLVVQLALAKDEITRLKAAQHDAKLAQEMVELIEFRDDVVAEMLCEKAGIDSDGNYWTNVPIDVDGQDWIPAYVRTKDKDSGRVFVFTLQGKRLYFDAKDVTCSQH